MVNLIPKPIKRISKTQKIFLYFLISLVVALTIAYIVLISLENKAKSQLSYLEEKINSQKTVELSDLENTIKNYKIEVDRYVPYLTSHIVATDFFNFLEDNIHPRVLFSQISLRLDSGDVNLGGQADNFLSLGQQLIIFKNHSEVEKIDLVDISLGETGEILFKLNLSLNKNLFKYLE